MSHNEEDGFLGPDNKLRLQKGQFVEVRIRVRIPEEATYLQTYDWVVSNVRKSFVNDPANPLLKHEFVTDGTFLYETSQSNDVGGKAQKDD